MLHCTATPKGREVSSSEIRHWHTDPEPKGRGWKQVGYTNEDAWVDPWEITNGAKGYNAVSRHVVYVGGVDANNRKKAKDTRTAAQKEALKKYVLDFHKKFPRVKIIGHYQVANKACPSFDVPKWLKEIGIDQK